MNSRCSMTMCRHFEPQALAVDSYHALAIERVHVQDLAYHRSRAKGRPGKADVRQAF